MMSWYFKVILFWGLSGMALVLSDALIAGESKRLRLQEENSEEKVEVKSLFGSCAISLLKIEDGLSYLVSSEDWEAYPEVHQRVLQYVGEEILRKDYSSYWRKDFEKISVKEKEFLEEKGFFFKEKELFFNLSSSCLGNRYVFPSSFFRRSSNQRENIDIKKKIFDESYKKYQAEYKKFFSKKMDRISSFPIQVETPLSFEVFFSSTNLNLGILEDLNLRMLLCQKEKAFLDELLCIKLPSSARAFSFYHVGKHTYEVHLEGKEEAPERVELQKKYGKDEKESKRLKAPFCFFEGTIQELNYWRDNLKTFFLNNTSLKRISLKNSYECFLVLTMENVFPYFKEILERKDIEEFKVSFDSTEPSLNGVGVNQNMVRTQAVDLIKMDGFWGLEPCLRANCSLTDLDISGIGGGARHWLFLFDHPTLIRLKLFLGTLSWEQKNELTEKIKRNFVLQSLDGCTEKESDGERFMGILSSSLERNKRLASADPTLTNLCLARMELEGKHLRSLIRVLERNKAITSLDLSHNFLTVNSLPDLRDFLAQNPQLRFLNLEGNFHPKGEDFDLFRSIFDWCFLFEHPALENLKFSREINQNRGKKDFQSLQKTMERNFSLQIIEISNDLSWNPGVSISFFSPYLERNKKLASAKNLSQPTLDLRGADLEDRHLQTLLRVIKNNKAITSLDLSCNSMTEKSIEYLKTAFSEGLSLKVLNLKKSIPLTERSLELLKQMVKKSTTLEDLFWDSVVCWKKEDFSFAVLNYLKGLEEKIKKSLEVNKVLWGALRNFSSREILHLRNASLKDKHVRALSEALKKNKTVKYLDLRNNAIGDRGASALMDMLRENSVLTYLYLSGNQLTEKAISALEKEIIALRESGKPLSVVCQDPSKDQKEREEREERELEEEEALSLELVSTEADEESEVLPKNTM